MFDWQTEDDFNWDDEPEAVEAVVAVPSRPALALG